MKAQLFILGIQCWGLKVMSAVSQGPRDPDPQDSWLHSAWDLNWLVCIFHKCVNAQRLEVRG